MLISDYDESIPLLSILFEERILDREEEYIIELRDSENKFIESTLESSFGQRCILDLLNLIEQKEFELNQVYKLNINSEALKKLVCEKNQIALEIYKKLNLLYNNRFQKEKDYLDSNFTDLKIRNELQKIESQLRKTVDLLTSALTNIPYKFEVYKSLIKSFKEEYEFLKKLNHYIPQSDTSSRVNDLYIERIKSIHNIPKLYHKNYFNQFAKFVKNNRHAFDNFKRIRNNLIYFENNLIYIVSLQYQDHKTVNEIYHKSSVKNLRKLANEIDFFYNDNFFLNAFWHTIQIVLSIILKNNSLSKEIPDEIIKKLYLISEAISKEVEDGNPIPSLEELSRNMDLSLNEIKLLLNIYFNPFHYQYGIKKRPLKNFEKGQLRPRSKTKTISEKLKKSSLKGLGTRDLINKVSNVVANANNDNKNETLSNDSENLIFIEKDTFILERPGKQQRRNPYIKEFIKRMAGGVCQLCEKKAPFLYSDGVPFLEVHHIIWLSEGGEDKLENTVALCPNCHRKMHILNCESDILKLIKIAKCNSIKTSNKNLQELPQ